MTAASGTEAGLAALTAARRHGVDPADQVRLVLALRLAGERRPSAALRLALAGMPAGPAACGSSSTRRAPRPPIRW
ncbi:hypothetical protein ACQEU3_05030 [Spirillospora sp. CA-253888]